MGSFLKLSSIFKKLVDASASICSHLFIKFMLLVLIGLSSIRLGLADIPLNASNQLGSNGAYYWIIRNPGIYYLDVPESVLSTSSEVAIWIASGDVTLDGRGKTITGPAVPSTSAGPNVYGVRVNGGQKISNVKVKNFIIKNKFYGVIFEAVDNGTIENINATNNQYGLYFWNTNYSILQFNVASSNIHSGIVCDADQTANSYNSIFSNTTSNNGVNGIFLWLACTNNAVNNNLSNNNIQMGISLSAGSDGNSVQGNSISGNSTGIWLASVKQNSISSNTLSGNINVGILFQESTLNHLFSNLIQNTQNAGIWLNQSATNNIYNNKVIYNHWGIFYANSSYNQLIYNNFFKNIGNVGSSGGGNNIWNTSQAGGKNIVGGPYLGGNYWASPSKSGFSEINNDNNCDGIIDIPYMIGTGNIDSLPLRYFFNKNKLVSEDLNNDGRADLAGLTAAGGIYYTTDLRGWTNLPGALDQLVAGDFNGDGRADLAGVTSAGGIYYTTDLRGWANLPGVLDQLVVGDFNGDGRADLAGLTVAGGIYYTTDLRGWTNLPGALDQLVVGDFNGDGRADLAGVTSAGGIYYTTDLARWAYIPGVLNRLVAGDFNGDGRADLAGATSAGGIYYTTDLRGWINLPGMLDELVAGDFNGDGRADLAGLTVGGYIYYTTNMASWINIPGRLSNICQ